MGDTRNYPELLSKINDALLKKHDEHTRLAIEDEEEGRSGASDWIRAGVYLEASKILCAMWMMPETKDKE